MSAAAKKRSAETATKRAEEAERKRVEKAEKRSKAMFDKVTDSIIFPDIERLTKYLDDGYLVDTANTMGQNGLTIAANWGFMDGVRLFLSRGANVDQRDIYNGTALHDATQWGRFEICLLLVEHGADPTVRSNDIVGANQTFNGETPLESYGSNLDRAEGADDDDPIFEGRPPLSAETKAAHCAEILAARDAYLLKVKRAENMDRRIPYIWVLAENRYRPLAYRLAEVPPVDPAAPVPPLAPETTHERQLVDVFGEEGFVRHITSFV